MNKKALAGGVLSVGILVATLAPGVSAFWPFDGWFSKGEVKAETDTVIEMVSTDEKSGKYGQTVGQYNTQVKAAVSKTVSLVNGYKTNINLFLKRQGQDSGDKKWKPLDMRANRTKLLDAYKEQIKIDTQLVQMKNEIVRLFTTDTEYFPISNTDKAALDTMIAELAVTRKTFGDQERRLADYLKKIEDNRTGVGFHAGDFARTEDDNIECTSNKKCPAGYKCVLTPMSVAQKKDKKKGLFTQKGLCKSNSESGGLLNQIFGQPIQSIETNTTPIE